MRDDCSDYGLTGLQYLATTGRQMCISPGPHVHVLLDGVGEEKTATGNRSSNEVEAAVTHEEMVVLERNRPARGAELKAGPDHATPSGFARLRKYRAGWHAAGGEVCNRAMFVVSEGRATFHVKQHVVPGIADLAAELA